MPRAHGSDRAIPGRDGRITLLCPRSKDWAARSESPAPGRPAHPGTAVAWDGEWYEVVEAAPANGASPRGMRYALFPWREGQTMRLTARYDDESEAGRAADRAVAERAERRSWTVLAMSPLLGHLPAPVQERYAREEGVSARLLTFASAAPLAAFGLVCFVLRLGEIVNRAPSVLPDWATTLGLLALSESSFRIGYILTQVPPIGSVAGWLVYGLHEIWRSRRPRAGEGIAAGGSDPKSEPRDLDDDELFGVVEPALALLTVREQLALAARFGFDWRRWGRTTAGVLLFLGMAGAATSGVEVLEEGQRTVPLVSLALAVALAAEQVARLVRLEFGPAPSVLGVLARPLIRPFLERVVDDAGAGADSSPAEPGSGEGT